MKKVLVLTTVLIAITIALLSVQRENTIIKHSEKESSEKDNDAIGMAQYLYKLMRDPVTGKVDLVAYYNAMKEAQAFAASRASNGLGLEWYSLGPDNIGGRTRAILFDKNDPNRVYAAGVTGGLWLSSNGGQSWVEIPGADQWQNIGITSICQDDSGYIYCGTGEGLAGLLSGYGNIGGTFVGWGMWKSTLPSGTVFRHLSSTTPTTIDPNAPWSEVNRLAANPHYPDSLFAAIQGGTTRGGLQLSTDGGQTWKTATGTPTSAFQGTDVKYSCDGKKVYAALNTIGGPGLSSASLYCSLDGGKTFTKRNGKGGFPIAGTFGGIARIEIAVSPTNPNYAYAALVNLQNGTNYGSIGYVVRTRDGGNTWDTIGRGTGFEGYYNLNGFDPTGPQGVYDLAMAVSPTDSNTLFLGGTTLWRWTPAQSWAQISFYGAEEFFTLQHSDMHALVFDPTNSNRLIIGSDGGVTQTLNPYASANGNGVQYTSLNRNYNVTQFYSVSADSEGRTFGGTQDNSNERINFLGNTVKSADLIFGGDGGATQIASNGKYYFAGVPGGSDIGRSSNSGNTWGSAFDHFADSIAGVAFGAQFVEPFNLWEDPDSLYIRDTSNQLPKRSLMAVGLNSGRVLVSPLANNFGTTPSWFLLQIDTGNVTAVTFSPDGEDLYVGTDQGFVYRYSGFDSIFIKNRWKYPLKNGISILYVWNAADSGIVKVRTSYTGFSSPSPGRIISSISVDPNDKDRVVITAANYGSTYTSWVARSTNATTGFTFIPIQGAGATALPKGPIYSSCIPHNGAILVGTQYGIYSSEDNGTSWALENNNILPNTPVFGIRELPYWHDYAIYAASYGRGLWASYSLTNETGINTVKTPNGVGNLNVFPNPMSGKGHVQYTLAKQGNVIINLYDIQGRLVKAIANENMNEGPIDIQFNVADLANGTYIVSVVQGSNQATKKMVVLH